MKTYHIITFGCQANVADSERIRRKLEDAKYKKASKLELADLIVINACSVRQSAIDRVYSKVQNFAKLKSQKSNLKIIVTGCLLPVDKRKLKDKVAEIWHPNDYFSCRPVYSDKTKAFVPIMTGCNNFCSFCVVPYTRGREKSRPSQEIIKEIKKLIETNYKEIWLIGQNVNSYPNFPSLLKTINDLPGNFKLNFLTSHPKDMSDELINVIAQSPKISKQIHLPVQSGDNKILRAMNRGYTVSQYKNLIKKLRQKIPGVKISTDVIVGFPGETKKQFENTVKLFKEIGFHKAYVAKYSPRTGTAAFKLKDNIPLEEKKRRWQILNKLTCQK